MKRIELQKVPHSVKIGEHCKQVQPNVTEDCILYENGEAVGFFMRNLPEKAAKLAQIANTEFLSDNVPKSKMNRSAGVMKGYKEKGKHGTKEAVRQMSCIIGSIPPRPHMKRPYPSRSSTHRVTTAKMFIKAMMLLALESEKLIQEVMPEQYERQKELFKNVPEKWRFGNLFTSSISNYNIPAAFHQDTGNIMGTVNVIITKRRNATGGNLNVPDYGATFDQCDSSILVYPAWRNVHGVTPIEPTFKDGYRNSLVFYPLKAFVEIKSYAL